MCIKKKALILNEEQFLILTVDMNCHIEPKQYPCILIYREEKIFGRPLIVDDIEYPHNEQIKQTNAAEMDIVK